MRLAIGAGDLKEFKMSFLCFFVKQRTSLHTQRVYFYSSLWKCLICGKQLCIFIPTESKTLRGAFVGSFFLLLCSSKTKTSLKKLTKTIDSAQSMIYCTRSKLRAEADLGFSRELWELDFQKSFQVLSNFF